MLLQLECMVNIGVGLKIKFFDKFQAVILIWITQLSLFV